MSIKIKYFFFVCVALALAACSDDITEDANLEKTIFDKEGDGTELSVAVDSLYKKYGSTVSFPATPSEVEFGWEGTNDYWMVPSSSEAQPQALRMVRFIRDDAFEGYPDILVSKYLPSRILFVDSICNSSTYRRRSLQDVMLVSAHGMVIAHIGKDLESWKNRNWQSLRQTLVNIMFSQIYDNNTAALEDFMDDKNSSWYYIYEESSGPYGSTPDPLGEYSVIQYNLYDRGYASAVMSNDNYEADRPTDAQDLGYFMMFLFNTPYKEQAHVYERFPRMRHRASLLYRFISDVLELDPIAMQNQACPSDPVPSGFYNSLSD